MIRSLFMHARRKALAVSVFLLIPPAVFHSRAVAADDCAPVVKAEMATLSAPGFRQYMSGAGGGERLLSIALGDAVYLAIGGPGGWQKMDRKEIVATAKEAVDDAAFRDCRPLGSEPVHGVSAAVYQFTMESRSQSFPASHDKVWIDAGGLLRKQSTDRGNVRYEYDNVKAPIP
jgi:hypothetical protein